MEVLSLIAQIATTISAVAAAITILVKPIRERVFNNKKTANGEKCLLRSEILRCYYKNKENKTIHQYELENLIKLYEAYKALGGNSFVQVVYEEILEWEIVK